MPPPGLEQPVSAPGHGPTPERPASGRDAAPANGAARQRIDAGRPLLAVFVVMALFGAGCVADDATTSTAIDPTADGDGTLNETVVDDGTDAARSLSVGEKPHVHDYWAGAEEVVIMDESVAVQELPAALFIGVFRSAFGQFMGQNENLYEAGSLSWRLPDEVLVYEGTGRLDISFDFSGLQERPDGLALYYSPANTNDFTMYPETIEHMEVYSIDVDYAMADIAHAKSSRWSFFARPVSDDGVAIMNGTVQVTISAVKAFDIEEAPAHPDHWGNDTQTLSLMDDAWDWQSSRTFFVEESEQMSFVLPERMIVPPGTGRVEIWLSWNVTSATIPTDYEMGMQLRTAADSRRGMNPESEFLADNQKHYDVAVDLSMVDSPYAIQSAWEFDLFLVPKERALFGAFFVNDAEGDVHVRMLAHKDPSWSVD